MVLSKENYEKIGGSITFHLVSRSFYSKVFKDPLLSPYFVDDNMEQADVLADYLIEKLYVVEKPFSVVRSKTDYNVQISHQAAEATENRSFSVEDGERWQSLFLLTIKNEFPALYNDKIIFNDFIDLIYTEMKTYIKVGEVSKFQDT